MTRTLAGVSVKAVGELLKTPTRSNTFKFKCALILTPTRDRVIFKNSNTLQQYATVTMVTLSIKIVLNDLETNASDASVF